MTSQISEALPITVLTRRNGLGGGAAWGNRPGVDTAACEAALSDRVGKAGGRPEEGLDGDAGAATDRGWLDGCETGADWAWREAALSPACSLNTLTAWTRSWACVFKPTAAAAICSTSAAFCCVA